MITPRFKLSQDDNFLTIDIRAPYCNLRELDVDIEGNIFLFVCKPYYLRLNLPGKIAENDNMKSSFNSESGEFSFTYEKQCSGEHFEDLELITKLLVTKVDASYNDGSGLIEILSKSEPEDCQASKETNIKDLQYGFGFALRAHKGFVKISSEFDEVFEIDPCEVPLPERRKLRLQYEQGKFNVDHYLADFIDDQEICESMSLKCPWEEKKDLSSFQFTDKELDFLKDLSNIEYNLTEEQIKYCHNGLLDILYAYCYERRSTFFEGNVESGWTIAKLASSLSWLDAFENPKATIIAAFRRSIIYPLYRHFGLSQKVFEDLKTLLSLDEKNIIRCLIEINDIFLKGDCCRYILNNLFIKDYITYIMKWDKALWKSTVKESLKIEIKKDDLGLNLTEIEDGFDLHENFISMNIKDDDDSESDDSSEDSSDDSDSSSSEFYDSDDSDCECENEKESTHIN